MALKIPDSMEELVYWTSRAVGDGYVKAWAEREICPNCKKGMMGKPRGKDGKVQIRAKHYECDSCGHTVEKQEYEDTLTCNIIYTCPKCRHQGEASVPYKRKKYQGVDAIVFKCDKCGEKVPITKKLKAIGEKD